MPVSGPRPAAPRPRGRRRRPSTYHHGDLARALAEESLLLLERQGAEAFSLREAATRCGVAVSAAYKHYASKAEVLHVVADAGFQALWERMEQLSADAVLGKGSVKAAEARLIAVGRAYILFAVERPHLFKLMFGPHGVRGGRGDTRVDAPAPKVSKALVAALQAVIDAHARLDVNVQDSKLFSWALVHGFSTMIVDGVWNAPNPATLERMIEEIGQAMVRTLR